MSAIEHRYSFLEPIAADNGLWRDAEDLYATGNFPGTARRMEAFEKFAPQLATCALNKLALTREERAAVTHVIVTSCTGLYAPGLDFDIVNHLGLNPSVERTIIGFMGCYAAVNALKSAHHIVRSEPESVVLVLSLELCTLHLQETTRSRADALVSPLRRRLRSLHGQRAPRGPRHRQFPRTAHPRDRSTDHLENPRARIRHASLRPGPGRNRARNERDRHPHHARPGSLELSTCGPFIREGERSSMPWRKAWGFPQTRCATRAISSLASAICLPRLSCSSSKTCCEVRLPDNVDVPCRLGPE